MAFRAGAVKLLAHDVVDEVDVRERKRLGKRRRTDELVRVLVDPGHQELLEPRPERAEGLQIVDRREPPVGLAADAGVASPITAIVETASEVATFLILGSPAQRTAWTCKQLGQGNGRTIPCQSSLRPACAPGTALPVADWEPCPHGWQPDGERHDPS